MEKKQYILPSIAVIYNDIDIITQSYIEDEEWTGPEMMLDEGWVIEDEGNVNFSKQKTKK